MEIIDYAELAKSRMTDQHRYDPAFVALVDTIVELKQIRQQQYFDFLDKFLDIDKSEGAALDVIGGIVGQPRALANFITEPYFGFQGARNAQGYDVGYWYSRNNAKLGTMKIVNDEQYRRLIKARIKNNKSRCTRDELLEILNLLTNDNGNEIQDIRHGVFLVNVSKDEDGLASYFLSKHRDRDTIFSIPLGYRITIAYKPVDETPVTIGCDGAIPAMHFSYLYGQFDATVYYSPTEVYSYSGDVGDLVRWLRDDLTGLFSDVDGFFRIENETNTQPVRVLLVPVGATSYTVPPDVNPTFGENPDGSLQFCLAPTP